MANRILTTHVGSMPRPHELLDLMKARLGGAPYDRAAYEAKVSAAVADVVGRQVDCGIDIVANGEQSKPGFFTYVRERLKGFEARPGMKVPFFEAEVAAFPEYYKDYFARAMGGGGWRRSDAKLKDVIGHIFRVKARFYSFEGANARHEHEYHVFESVRPASGKVLIPGVITHASNIVEHPELIAERLVRYARIVGAENVIASADCGFSSQACYKTEVHPKVIWERFKALAEGARLASSQL